MTQNENSVQNKKKPFIIPIFLPHAACPNRCLFCNQGALHPEEAGLDFFRMKSEVKRWLGFERDALRPVELAFYGGNFLGLSEDLVRECILFAERELPQGRIRFSTRPDSISRESLLPFAEKKIQPVVELGIQSLDNTVLLKSLRGHTAEDVFRAIGLLEEIHGEIIAQMMLGLPGADESSDLISAEKLSSLPIHGARIAPTLVLEGSGLARLYKEGGYKPLDFNEAVRRCAKYMGILEGSGIPVIRLGLQTDDALEKSILAGPHHPAFGEWVRSFSLREEVLAELQMKGPFCEGEEIHIRVSDKIMGRMRGMGRENEIIFNKAVFPAKLFIKADLQMPAGAWVLERI